jgi:hypothetical protein
LKGKTIGSIWTDKLGFEDHPNGSIHSAREGYELKAQQRDAV